LPGEKGQAAQQQIPAPRLVPGAVLHLPPGQKQALMAGSGMQGQADPAAAAMICRLATPATAPGRRGDRSQDHHLPAKN